MLPHQFVRVSIRRIWWKIKQPQLAAETGDLEQVPPRQSRSSMALFDPCGSSPDYSRSVRESGFKPSISHCVVKIALEIMPRMPLVPSVAQSNTIAYFTSFEVG